eukprot:225776_1
MGANLPKEAFQPSGYIAPRTSSYDAAQTEAYFEAAKQQENERARIEARQRELEYEEIVRQRKVAIDKRIQREKEQKETEARIKQHEEKKKKERDDMKRLLAKQAQEKIDEETKQLQELKAKSASTSPQNAYMHFKHLNTLKTIQEIGTQVDRIAVVGQIVKERAGVISAELINTLGDDYTLIKSEINRYKKYGKEMESMTDLFITEFQKAFNIIQNKTQQKDFANKYLKTQQEIKEMEQEIKEEPDDDIKEMLCEELHKLNALDNAIKNIQNKLFLMEQYYDEMITDYKWFKGFIEDKRDDLNTLTDKFSSVAHKLKDDILQERDIFMGTNEKQKTIFKVDFEYEQNVKSGNSVSGSIFGSIWRKLVGPRDEDLVGFGKTETMSGSVVVVSEKKTYNGKDQAIALENIARNIEKCESYKKLKEQLALNVKMTDDGLYKCRRRKNDILEVAHNVTQYKLKLKELKDKFKKGDEVDDNQKQLINRRLTQLCVEIQSIINTMK